MTKGGLMERRGVMAVQSERCIAVRRKGPLKKKKKKVRSSSSSSSFYPGERITWPMCLPRRYNVCGALQKSG